MPHTVLRSDEWASLSPRATKLLCDLLAQYKGDNNGDLSPAMTLMRKRGWSSGANLAYAVRELESSNFIVCTRRGGRHKASLYAVAFFAIDWCAGKLEIQAPTRQFLGTWRRINGNSPSPLVGQSSRHCTTGGSKATRIEANCATGGAVEGTFRPPIDPQVDTFLEVYHCRDSETALDRWADDGGALAFGDLAAINAAKIAGGANDKIIAV